jgi:formamidopyrimidine-DNA glycosylase
MPELPEVETVRLQLWQRLKGKTVDSIRVLNPKSVRNDGNFGRKLKGSTIKDIGRIGKLLIFSFKENPDRFLLAHLKMTGQLFVADEKGEVSARGGHETPHDHTLPNRHTRVIINFSGRTTLYFNDQRIFGYLHLTDKAGMELARARFGPEPQVAGFDLDYFLQGLSRSRQNIKARLLDQSFVAGLGNIYVDESLFRAGLSPARPANSLTPAEAKRLAEAASTILKEAIKHGGTTFQSFKDSDGKKGNYTRRLKVFAQQGKPCPTCGDTIQKTRLAGRGTHFCPTCQH